MRTSSITQLFEAVHLVVLNLSENIEFQNRMDAYGMTSQRVQEGNTLLINAQQLHHTQETHYDQARWLSLQMEQDSNAMLEVFREHVAIAKIAFRKEPHILQELKINKIASGRWALTQQALAFYTKAPLHMDKLSQFGADQASFEQNKTAAEALFTLKAQRLKTKGQAENSTQEKTQAIKALRAWYGEFRKLARIAFQDTPQVLETFGIVVRSSKKKSKKPFRSSLVHSRQSIVDSP